MQHRRAPRPRRPLAETFRRMLVSSMWSPEMLDPLSERARALWLRLSLAVESTAIPGLVLMHADDLAVALTAPRSAPWSADEVERVAASIPATMLRADWRAGLIWIPPVFRWHAPASPKNVAAWRRPWAEVPASPLAVEIHDELRLVCAGRGASFVRVFAELAPPLAVAALAPMEATIQIAGVEGGVTVTASGIPENAGAAVLRELARRLGIPITIDAPAIVDVVEAPQPSQPALAGLADFAPAPTGRRTKAQAAAEDRAHDITRIIAYQRERRAEAFERAHRELAEIDEDACRKLIAERLAAGASVVDCTTAIDRQFEKVASAPSAASMQAEAGWWTATAWTPTKFRALLAMQMGAAPPDTARKLAKMINDAAPAGASPIRVLDEIGLRPLAQLLTLRPDVSAIVATTGTLAEIVTEQERSLRRRAQRPGEERLVRLWGAGMFRAAAWSGIQTATDRWHGADEAGRAAIFMALSEAMRGEAMPATAVHTS